MAQESVSYQCPNCMGPLRYKGDSGMLECEFCESTFTPAQVEEAYAAKQREADEKAEAAVARAEAGQQSSFERMADEAAGASSVVTEDVIDAAVAVGAQAESSIASYLSRASWNEEERAGMRTYLCSSCGAQLTSDATTAIQECPYCGNQAMAPGSFVDTAKPDLVIPFKLDKAAAEQTLTEYYKGKKFLPKEFAAQNRIAHVQGVYVPFWLYDGSASVRAPSRRATYAPGARANTRLRKPMYTTRGARVRRSSHASLPTVRRRCPTSIWTLSSHSTTTS